MKCSVEEIKSGNRVFINDESKSERYVKILSIGDTDIVNMPLWTDTFSVRNISEL